MSKIPKRVLSIDNPIDKTLVSDAMWRHRKKMWWWQIALTAVMTLCAMIGTQVYGIGVVLVFYFTIYSIYLFAIIVFGRQIREWKYRYYFRSVKADLYKSGFDWDFDEDEIANIMKRIFKYVDL